MNLLVKGMSVSISLEPNFYGASEADIRSIGVNHNPAWEIQISKGSKSQTIRLPLNRYEMHPAADFILQIDKILQYGGHSMFISPNIQENREYLVSLFSEAMKKANENDVKLLAHEIRGLYE